VALESLNLKKCPIIIIGTIFGGFALKRKLSGLCFAFALLLSSSAGLLLVEQADANSIPGFIHPQDTPVISINSDGTVTPQTDLISRSGDTYTLTADVTDHQIRIKCGNVVFDGNGHRINVKGHAVLDENGNQVYNNGKMVYINIQTYGLVIDNYTNNVTVRNVEISSSWYGVWMLGCLHCQVTDVKTNSGIKLSGSDYNNVTHCTAKINISYESENNVISKNNITELSVSSHSNAIYQNNMLLDNPPYLSSIYPSYNTSWNDGSVGNYWSDYLTKYPNASEIGDTGVGDTPYVVDEDNADYHPLMYPYDIENDQIALPARGSSNVESELIMVAFIAGGSAVAVSVLAAGLLAYRKKRISKSQD
jgi:nitrous oxidase accessory protein NosD